MKLMDYETYDKLPDSLKWKIHDIFGHSVHSKNDEDKSFPWYSLILFHEVYIRFNVHIRSRFLRVLKHNDFSDTCERKLTLL